MKKSLFLPVHCGLDAAVKTVDGKVTYRTWLLGTDSMHIHQSLCTRKSAGGAAEHILVAVRKRFVILRFIWSDASEIWILRWLENSSVLWLLNSISRMFDTHATDSLSSFIALLSTPYALITRHLMNSSLPSTGWCVKRFLILIVWVSR